MKEEIKISGKSYPLKFTLFFQSEFEDDSGVSLESIDKLPKSKSTKTMLKMLYWALVDGARVGKVDFPLTYFDLLDEVEKDPSIAETFTKILLERATSKKAEATVKDEKSS